MSILLDRLCGYDVDDTTGKTKLSIHAVIDAVLTNLAGWTGSPTNGEINTAFQLSGTTFDPTDSQVADLNLLAALPGAPGAAKRTEKEIEAVLRLGEQYSSVIDETRVQQMLGVTLSTTH
jgi:hypothetical protein